MRKSQSKKSNSSLRFTFKNHFLLSPQNKSFDHLKKRWVIQYPENALWQEIAISLLKQPPRSFDTKLKGRAST